MAVLPLPLRLLLLLGLGTSTTSASPASFLFRRDDTCQSNNLLSCPQGLPSDFCCSAKSTCIALAANTTALCCPNSESCNLIQPITCDLSEQDPKNSLTAALKTTVFNIKLESCGDNTCCPFGFSCSSDNLCQKDADQSKSPSQEMQTTTMTSTTTVFPSSATQAASSTTAVNLITSTPAASSPTASPASSSGAGDAQSKGPATTSIIGGVVGGCLVLLLIAVIIFLYIRRSNRRHAANLEKSGGVQPRGNGGRWSVFMPTISNPIMQPNSYRTDFILKPPSTRASVNNAAPADGSPKGLHPRVSIPNPFDSPNPSAHSPVPSHASSSASHEDHPPRTGRVGARLKPIRAMKTASSRVSRRFHNHTSLSPRLRREPSGENIDVFADPDTVRSTTHGTVVDKRSTRGTTFTDMMNQADLGDVHSGRPYVPGTTPRI